MFYSIRLLETVNVVVDSPEIRRKSCLTWPLPHQGCLGRGCVPFPPSTRSRDLPLLPPSARTRPPTAAQRPSPLTASGCRGPLRHRGRHHGQWWLPRSLRRQCCSGYSRRSQRLASRWRDRRGEGRCRLPACGRLAAGQPTTRRSPGQGCCQIRETENH